MRISLLIIFALFGALSLSAFEPDSKTYKSVVRPFLDKHCFSCHGPKKKKGKLRLDTLHSSVIEGSASEVWIEVINSLSLGEMPPEDEPQPKVEELEEVMGWITGELKKARRHLQSSGGRVLMRRLNRQEYTRTIEDLFQMNFVNGQGPMALLSPDGKIDGFTKMSKALMLDPSLMSNYYELGKTIAAKAIQTAQPKIQSEKRRFEVENTAQSRGIAYITKRRSSGMMKNGIKLYAEGLRTAGFLKHSATKTMIPELGTYTIRIKAGAFKGERGTPLFMKLKSGGLGDIKQWEVTASADNPQIYEVTVDIAPQGNGELQLGFVNGTGFVEIERVVNELFAAVKKLSKEGKRLEAERARSRFVLEGKSAGLAQRLNPKTYTLEKLPYIFVDWIEIEGPQKGQWPPKSMQTFFPSGYEKSEKDLKAATAILKKLLPRAFRRPIKPGELDVYLGLFQKQTTAGNKFDEALRVVISAVLCSPDFLYIFEPNETGKKRKLTSFEMASRMSYFLWSSMPDDKLFMAAAKGKLKSAGDLDKAVDSLLADSRSSRFYEGFVNEWLKIEEFDHFEPDKRTYKDYFKNEFIGIGEDMKKEPVEFVRELIQKNLSMLNCIKSDWSMLNEKLAKFYGIKGVSGSEFRRVRIPKELNRGGFITMAGFHKWGSDGNRTKPVERGKYVLDVLFNAPAPPPPPNAGEIEPNIKGKNLTVRDRLLQHQQIQSCAVCHKKIDPYGLGLENFNVIGKWRDLQDGEGFRGKKVPKVVIQGKFPSGETYNNFEEYRDVLAGMKDRFARGLTEKMLTYALGRTIEPSDLGEIDDIVELVKKDNYSMRTLIKAIVKSEAFQSK
ncbi:MAG: DUF1592 domain-containing protein [Lentisphaeraceae bacterium]|nr:DUF1592 domain-containing protein [Lentisphaeraceae bacterium]